MIASSVGKRTTGQKRKGSRVFPGRGLELMVWFGRPDFRSIASLYMEGELTVPTRFVKNVD